MNTATRRNLVQCGLLALLVPFLVTGCTTIKPDAMVADDFEVIHRHAASLSVAVPPGPRTPQSEKLYGKGRWTSAITGKTFETSLNESLRKSGVFSSILDTPNGDYLLHVFLVDATEPADGLNMKVVLVTRWILTKQSTGQDKFREDISTTYLVNPGPASPTTRLRQANEGAGRENIKEGMRRLSAVKL